MPRVQPHPTEHDFRARRQGLHDKDLHRARRDRGAILRLLRHVSEFATYWSDGKGTHAPNVPIESCACPANCGLCSNHLSHTGLANIIVTNRCDLTCWYCFFYVKKGLEGAYVYEPELNQIREMVRALKAERPVPGNSLQITGGEPTLRPELPEIVRIIKEE